MTWERFVVLWLMLLGAFLVGLIGHYALERRRGKARRRRLPAFEARMAEQDLCRCGSVIVHARTIDGECFVPLVSSDWFRQVERAVEGLLPGEHHAHFEMRPLLLRRPRDGYSLVASSPRGYGSAALLDRVRDRTLDSLNRDAMYIEWAAPDHDDVPSANRYWLDRWAVGRVDGVDAMRREGAAQLQAGRLYVSQLAERTFRDLDLDPSMESQFVRGEN